MLNYYILLRLSTKGNEINYWFSHLKWICVPFSINNAVSHQNALQDELKTFNNCLLNEPSIYTSSLLSKQDRQMAQNKFLIRLFISLFCCDCMPNRNKHIDSIHVVKKWNFFFFFHKFIKVWSIGSWEYLIVDCSTSI